MKLLGILLVIFALGPAQAVEIRSIFGKKSVKLMTYNLENLFDNKHDAGKVDWTYLPLKVKQSSSEVQDYCHGLSNEFYRKTCLELDWSDRHVSAKIQNMAKVIRKANADIVVVQEVENRSVLKQLNREGRLGYSQVILEEGPDTRGIDVGILSRYPQTEPAVLHLIATSPLGHITQQRSLRPTRGILQATFKIGNKKLTVFANHWPSQSNPDAYRARAARTLLEAVDNLPQDGRLVMALGDFNTVDSDHPHSINDVLTNQYEHNYFIGASELNGRHQLPQGSHWYRGHWELLDRIFLLARQVERKGFCSLEACLEPVQGSFKAIKESFMLRDLDWTDHDIRQSTRYRNIPYRFDYETLQGYSDHLPIVFKVRI